LTRRTVEKIIHNPCCNYLSKSDYAQWNSTIILLDIYFSQKLWTAELEIKVLVWPSSDSNLRWTAGQWKRRYSGLAQRSSGFDQEKRWSPRAIPYTSLQKSWVLYLVKALKSSYFRCSKTFILRQHSIPKAFSNVFVMPPFFIDLWNIIVMSSQRFRFNFIILLHCKLLCYLVSTRNSVSTEWAYDNIISICCSLFWHSLMQCSLHGMRNESRTMNYIALWSARQ
jgi:hypothetical protein